MNAQLAPAAVVVRRTIAASPLDLFDAWLDAEALAQWMRPGTIQKTSAKVDPRVGGRYEIVMVGDSETYVHTGTYRVIDRPKRLVFTWYSPAAKHESVVTVDFLPAALGTEVVITHEQLPESARAAHARGWASGLEHLDEFSARI